MKPSISIVIATKDRYEDLCRAIQSCLRLRGSVEVIVLDDGSEDPRYRKLAEQFPSISVFNDCSSRGYIFRRNEGASLAKSDIIVSIDDDAELRDPDLAAKLAVCFSDESVAVVAMPYIDVNKSERVKQEYYREELGAPMVHSYVGTAHALRRASFLKLGGYREALVHQGEERDYSIRVLAAGYRLVISDTEPLYHYESSRRSFERMDFFGRRNDIIFHFQNTPFPSALISLPKVVVGGIVHSFRVRRFSKMMAGMMCGLYECFLTSKHPRHPVSQSVYRHFIKLLRSSISRNDARNSTSL